MVKLITYGRSRKESIVRMRRALDEMIVEGIRTNIPLHRRIMDEPDFESGNLSTKFLDRLLPKMRDERLARLAAEKD